MQSILPSLELDLLNAAVAARYVIVSATTIMGWDVLTHLSDEIELLFLPRSFRPPTIAYFISRYTFLAYFILQLFAISESNVEDQCNTPKATAVSAVGYVAVVTTLLQFLFRAKAIFSDNRFARWFFTCLWLVAAGGTSLLISGASSNICTDSDYSYYIPVISVLVHDSCVFVAISYRIYRMSMISWSPSARSDLPSTVRDRFQRTIATLWGKNLPSLTRALLREGQLYYLISLTGSISTLWLMLDMSLPPSDHLLLAPMHVLVLNVTAGHVFREVRLGRMREREISLPFQHELTTSNDTFERMSFALVQETPDEISLVDIC
ncbi:hypothetical protein BT96DRAFT_922253 [Gymnopus androsaceus JB14]|uniref:DUF6533 domain-containing protein n=1 Tax=Gymnopus androsaceus JB14 TaxID=1447944 RepID=A0A6A4HF02_9AGAR|nr:hypothetical protein BT96DRAFT_922253 [Gymnopus androsaceus JB14]